MSFLKIREKGKMEVRGRLCIVLFPEIAEKPFKLHNKSEREQCCTFPDFLLKRSKILEAFITSQNIHAREFFAHEAW